MRLWLVLLSIFVLPFCFAEPDNSQTQLNLLRLQRVELLKSIQKDGKYQSQSSLDFALRDGTILDPKILDLKTLNNGIQKLRVQVKSQTLPPISESTHFGRDYLQAGDQIQGLKQLKTYVQKNPELSSQALSDIKLMQKQGYMRQAELKLKHELLADKTFTSVDALNKAIGTGHKDPRIQSLNRIRVSQAELDLQLAPQAKAKVQSLQAKIEAAPAIEPRLSRAMAPGDAPMPVDLPDPVPTPSPAPVPTTPDLPDAPPATTPAPTPPPAQGHPNGPKPGGIIEGTLNQEIGVIGHEIHAGIKTDTISNYINSVKEVGTKVTDKVLEGAPDEATGRDGFEVKRDEIVSTLQQKIGSVEQQILSLQASGGSKSKIEKLKSLKSTLEAEVDKATVGPQGLALRDQISTLKNQVEILSQNGGDKKLIGDLEKQISLKEGELDGLKGNSKSTAKDYIKDGLHFAVVSAATQGVLNLIDQVKEGKDVNLMNAFEFVTTPQFLLGTAGAYAGGLAVQKLMATGMGKIAMATIGNMVPGPMRFIIEALPYAIGSTVGSDLLTGNLGKHSITDMVLSGVGSSVGMMLGSAIFPPLGSIAGSVLGGMAAEWVGDLLKGKDQMEVATRMQFQPHWIEFSDANWVAQDMADYGTVFPDNRQNFSENQAIASQMSTLEDLQAAREQAHKAYTESVQMRGSGDESTQRAYNLVQELDLKIDALKNNSIKK